MNTTFLRSNVDISWDLTTVEKCSLLLSEQWPKGTWVPGQRSNLLSVPGFTWLLNSQPYHTLLPWLPTSPTLGLHGSEMSLFEDQSHPLGLFPLVCSLPFSQDHFPTQGLLATIAVMETLSAFLTIQNPMKKEDHECWNMGPPHSQLQVC